MEVTETLLKNYDKFRNFLAKRLPDASAADDILQQSLLKAWKSPPSSLQEQSVLAWFYTILKNSIADHYRSKASEEQAMTQYPVPGITLPRDFEEGVCECMHDLLPTMPENYAAVLRKVDFEGKSPVDAAQELAISRSNLDVRLFRARKALKKALEKMCGACTEHACLQCSCKSSRAAR